MPLAHQCGAAGDDKGKAHDCASADLPRNTAVSACLRTPLPLVSDWSSPAKKWAGIGLAGFSAFV